MRAFEFAKRVRIGAVGHLLPLPPLAHTLSGSYQRTYHRRRTGTSNPEEGMLSHTVFVQTRPHGGFRKSGFGRFNGIDGLREFTQTKAWRFFSHWPWY